MKKTVFLILFILVSVIKINAQFLNSDIINKEFCDTLNDYRKSLGLGNIFIESKYKNFVNNHSQYQAKINRLTHCNEIGCLQSRIDQDPNLYGLVCQENCTLVDVEGGVDIDSIANEVLKHFYNSKQHNEGLINPNFKKCCVAAFKKGDWVYVTLILSE